MRKPADPRRYGLAPLPRGLTRRQWEVWKLMLDGYSITEIANILRITRQTVYQHRDYVLAKSRRYAAYVAKTQAPY